MTTPSDLCPGRGRPFAWATYKTCKILATGIFNPETQYWTPTATVYWKRGNEKHLAFLEGPRDSSATRSEAAESAMSLAIEWCDQQMVEYVPVVNAPR
jgi:hypothetical protein